MTNRSHKPVKQCAGCMLNEGERCAAFDFPAQQWAHNDCKGYNNIELAREYGLVNDQKGAHERKTIRKAKAKYNNTIEHEEGRTMFKKIKWP